MNVYNLYAELVRIRTIIWEAKELGDLSAAVPILNQLVYEVDIEAKNKANRESSNASIAKAANAVLKNARKIGLKEFLWKAYRGTRYLDVCDGHRLIRFNLDTAPVLEEHPEGYVGYIACDKILPDSDLDYKDEPVVLPTIADLKKFIAESKAAKTKRNYQFETPTGIHYFDPQYLLDMLQALPNASAYLNPQGNRSFRNLIFEAPNGIGLLLPRRKGNDT